MTNDEILMTAEVLSREKDLSKVVIFEAIEAALAAPFANVLDLGTGSGCIVLTLVAETPGSRGMGVDISPEALNVAYWNRNALRLEFPDAAIEQLPHLQERGEVLTPAQMAGLADLLSG